MESLETPIIDNTKKNKIFVSKELIEDWKKWYLKEGHSFRSMASYYSYIKIFVGEGIELKQKNIDLFRESHYNTVSSSALKKFFYFLVAKKQYPREILNFYYGKNKSTKKFPESIEPIEVAKLINSIESLKEKYLVLFTYELALRISETLKIKWEDFNWNTWILNKEDFGVLNIKNSKRNKFRSIPVKSELMKIIYNAHSNKTSDGIPIGNLVFDFGIMDFLTIKEKTIEQNQYDYMNYAQNKVRDLLYKKSKEVLGKRIHPHQLRHGKAQFLLDNGVSLDGLKLLLGHDKISTTEIYAQSSPEKLKRELKAFDTFKETQIK